MTSVNPDLTIARFYGEVQESLYRHIVEPLLFQLNWIGYAEVAYDGVEWFMLGGAADCHHCAGIADLGASQSS